MTYHSFTYNSSITFLEEEKYKYFEKNKIEKKKEQI